jgi:hypothetical protein
VPGHSVRLVVLPGGGKVLARGLGGVAAPIPAPEFGLYLLGHPLDRPSVHGRLLVGLRAWTPPWPHQRLDPSTFIDIRIQCGDASQRRERYW